MMRACTVWVEHHDKSILTVIVLGGLAVRFTIWILLQNFASNYLLTNSLTDAYLFPRLSASPWQVDWSYGPLTYLLYWLVAHATYASILGKIINFMADSVSTYLVAVLSAKFVSRVRSLLAAAGWTFASLVVWASVFGSVDPLPILATLGAVYFALNGRIRPAILLIGVGFALKWYPILILPIILRASVSKRDLPRLILSSIYPFVLTGLLMAVNSSISGVTITNQLELIVHNFSLRTPAGPSIWNLFQAVSSTSSTTSSIPFTVIYFSMFLALVVLTLRSQVRSGIQFLESATIALFVLVNIANQIQGNYLLWYYPFMLIVILKERIQSILFAKLSLLLAGFVFDYLFIYPRLGIIMQGPLALIASPTPYDVLSIIAYQASAWSLLYLLIRPQAESEATSENSRLPLKTRKPASNEVVRDLCWLVPGLSRIRCCLHLQSQTFSHSSSAGQLT